MADIGTRWTDIQARIITELDTITDWAVVKSVKQLHAGDIKIEETPACIVVPDPTGSETNLVTVGKSYYLIPVWLIQVAIDDQDAVAGLKAVINLAAQVFDKLKLSNLNQLALHVNLTSFNPEQARYGTLYRHWVTIRAETPFSLPA